jgi:hypothetical protein
MFVSVIHRVTDPDAFWAAATNATQKIPAELKLSQSVTSEDRSTTICLWESPSLDELSGFLEPLLGQVCKNEYIPIDPKNSMGLPATAEATA